MNGQEGRRQTRENKGNCDNSASCPRLHSIWLYTNLLPMCMSSRFPLYVHEVDFFVLNVSFRLPMYVRVLYRVVLLVCVVFCSCVYVVFVRYVVCIRVCTCTRQYVYVCKLLHTSYRTDITNTQNDKLNKAKLKRIQSLFRRKFPIPPVLSHQSDHEQEQL